MLLRAALRNVTEYVNQLWFIDVNKSTDCNGINRFLAPEEMCGKRIRRRDGLTQ